MEVRLTELRYREVINISDGTRLGFVSDAILDLTSGRVLALIVPGPARFFGLFGRESDYILPWESIARIGGDIVLIEGAAEIRRDRQPRKFKIFFQKRAKRLAECAGIWYNTRALRTGSGPATMWRKPGRAGLRPPEVITK